MQQLPPLPPTSLQVWSARDKQTPNLNRDLVSRKVPPNAIQPMLLRRMNAALLAKSQWYPNYKSGYRVEENMCKENKQMLLVKSQEVRPGFDEKRV